MILALLLTIDSLKHTKDGRKKSRWFRSETSLPLTTIAAFSIFLDHTSDILKFSSFKMPRLDSRSLIVKKLTIMLLHTFRTNTMTKFNVRMFLEITFYPFPVALVIANIFTMCANGDKAPQCFNL